MAKRTKQDQEEADKRPAVFFRPSDDQHAVLQRAAEIDERSVADFCRVHSVRAAKKLISETEGKAQ